eukprot:TRINITY_DN24743_c0_g1_i3.p1 TRINITY_DN24743_c0_g1~~TRINITY_DN24743_c0_g1_i3.p1  ORF type:complete len:161 (+),score=31.24 TRINITY_DN24743_c0_g1_i3:62-484(+)
MDGTRCAPAEMLVGPSAFDDQMERLERRLAASQLDWRRLPSNRALRPEAKEAEWTASLVLQAKGLGATPAFGIGASSLPSTAEDEEDEGIAMRSESTCETPLAEPKGSFARELQWEKENQQCKRHQTADAALRSLERIFS